MNPTEVREVGSVKSWDIEADVVVVGLGCAGACAAIEAAEAGAEVLVLERAGGGGGTSANSGGLIYMGGGTPVQRACGFDDTPEEMFQFLLAALGPEPDEAKLRLFCGESVAHFNWFESHGVPFKYTFYPEPGTEAPSDDCLVYSGGEDTFPFNRIARPAPRAHKPRHPAAAGGFLMQKLVAAAERSGARIVCDARAETLVIDRDGAVAGLVLWRDLREQYVRARRGVILTAGGFINNRDMVARHSPRIWQCSFKLGVEGDDGRAIRMAMGAGADIIHMDAAEVAIPLTPPRRLMRGIVVNRFGQRFINEDTYYGRVGQEALFKHDGHIYLIADTAIYERNMIGFEPTYVEDTIAELEQSMGLPAASLQTTVEYYNRFAARGEDPLFHKLPEFIQPLTTPPYAAIDCRPERVLWATFTLGGLHTLPTGEVLDPDGRLIPGLYAAGRTTSGIAAWGYCSGISLGDGTFFGRQAGCRAAAALR
ncbi:MAG: FAD-dependent oxidoreductase [Deltaproteobacteria bacterium]|nr:FAD-dependent oxidoreductase [Deltaproteobacteria bacterium]